MAETPRNAVLPTRLECRVCHALISVPGGHRAGRFRCPKCLHEMDLRDDLHGADGPGRSAPAGPQSAGLNAGTTAAVGSPDQAVGEGKRPEGVAEELCRLRAERDDLSARLRAATSALQEAGALIARLADLEQRLGELGGRYLQAAFRVTELERETARLSGRTTGPEVEPRDRGG